MNMAFLRGLTLVEEFMATCYEWLRSCGSRSISGMIPRSYAGILGREKLFYDQTRRNIWDAEPEWIAGAERQSKNELGCPQDCKTCACLDVGEGMIKEPKLEVPNAVEGFFFNHVISKLLIFCLYAIIRGYSHCQLETAVLPLQREYLLISLYIT